MDAICPPAWRHVADDDDGRMFDDSPRDGNLRTQEEDLGFDPFSQHPAEVFADAAGTPRANGHFSGAGQGGVAVAGAAPVVTLDSGDWPASQWESEQLRIEQVWAAKVEEEERRRQAAEAQAAQHARQAEEHQRTIAELRVFLLNC